MKVRRIQALRLPIEFITRLFTTDNVTLAQCVDGLPPDAEFLFAFADHQQQDMFLVFYHPAFDATPVGVGYAIRCCGNEMIEYKGAGLLAELAREWTTDAD